MRRLTGLLVVVALVLAGRVAEAQIDAKWLRADTTTKTVDFTVVAGLTGLNGGMNFNGFTQGKLNLTVPHGWTVAFHFKNQDQNLPHSVEIIADTNSLPIGPVPPAFDRATTGKLEQGFSAGQGADFRFLAGKTGSFLIFCAVPGHGGAGMWIRLTVSATAEKPTLAATPGTPGAH